MSKKPISWLELIKLKLGEAKGSSLNDIMPETKKAWAQIKAGTHPEYIQGKSQTFARKKKSGDNNNTKKNRKSMKSASASSASASPMSASSASSSPTVEELLAQIKLCGKCKKQVDKLMKKKSLKGGNCCGPV
jgi:hypothetical protein